MSTSILKGITTGLLVTVLTLLAVLGTTYAGFSESTISYLVDFGLLLSCLAAGYKASRSSGRILPAALASGGYAVVGVMLLALYFPIDGVGALKIISEGTGLGLLAGVLGAGALSSGHDQYERMETGYNYPRRENYYERRDITSLVRGDGRDRRDRRDSDPGGLKGYPGEGQDYRITPSPYADNPEVQRAKIYELCNHQAEKTEEDEAFDWWKVEAKRQLKG